MFISVQYILMNSTLFMKVNYIKKKLIYASRLGGGITKRIKSTFTSTESCL